MFSPIAVCPVHGAFVSPILGFAGSGTVSFTGCAVSCPTCGFASPLIDGTYEIVGDALKAFRAPGITRHDIEAFRNIAQAEKDGVLSANEAEEQAAKISSAFAKLLAWANGNAGALGILLGIITLFVAIYAIHDSDLTAAEAHSDALQLRQATLSEKQVQQKIYEALQQQSVASPSQAAPLLPMQEMRPPIQGRTQGRAAPQNRFERRKAASIAKRQSPD